MPQFHMPMGSDMDARAFADLDSFVQGYIEAMFFTSTGYDEDGELQYATFADLADETLAQIEKDCEAFHASLPKDDHGRTWLDLAYDYAPNGYDETRAGHDFWFTRNRHGVGFRDRELGMAGDKLTDAAHKFREIDLYMGDDGKLYLA